MTADDLIRRLRRFARKRGQSFTVVARRGKGSHVMAYLGDRKAPVPMHKGRDLACGTLAAILEALGIDPADLE